MSWFVVAVPFHFVIARARWQITYEKSSNGGHQLALWSHANGIHLRPQPRTI